MNSDWKEFSFETKDRELYELVYDCKSGALIEVRIFLHKFNSFMPLQMIEMRKFPSKMTFFFEKVDEQIKHEIELKEFRNTRPEYNNDDPEVA